MSKDFKTLIDFLDRFGPEVSGKALVAPQDEVAAKLQRFAAGECDKEERAEVCEMLRTHPSWLRWLADKVKTARGDAASST
jgi:hypothetical protein